ncbi:MAG: DUF6261 family protein [Tannerellaceae bacterium]|jgi:hypothetical protein|nr:DUF6261 family protein [Tannerellaceae bacterium]
MKKRFIVLTFKSILRKLLIGEHYFFYSRGIIEPLLPTINDLPTLLGMFNALRAVFLKEDELYKLSQAALQTPDIRLLNELRIAYFNFIWECLEILKLANNPAYAEAIAKLEYLHHTYANIPYENYYDMSGALLNFLQDCESALYQPSIQLLSSYSMCNIAEVINGEKVVNENFITLYMERSISKEHVAELGKLSAIRFDVDDVFDAFVEAINVAWTANEMGAKDANVRQKLLDVKETIAAAIHQAELVLARRGRHKIKDDGTTDEGTQTPDITNPPAPDTPPQAPDISVPPINPEDLNPPSAGEH